VAIDISLLRQSAMATLARYRPVADAQAPSRTY
jgi:4-hydroxy-2-oxoheptanedioate aldolase